MERRRLVVVVVAREGALLAEQPQIWHLRRPGALRKVQLLSVLWYENSWVRQKNRVDRSMPARIRLSVCIAGDRTWRRTTRPCPRRARAASSSSWPCWG